MLRSIKRPREEISTNAPRLIQIQINPEKIGLVIGPGGKTIRRLQDETGAKIDIEDSGIVTLASPTAEGAEAARDKIQAMTEGVRVGQIYEGRVTSIKDFGAFVEILPGKDGLVHISELSEGYVGTVTDICRVGDPMLVKAIAVDDQDRVKLSRKAALAERGEVDPNAGNSPARRRPPPAAAAAAAATAAARPVAGPAAARRRRRRPRPRPRPRLIGRRPHRRPIVPRGGRRRRPCAARRPRRSAGPRRPVVIDSRGSPADPGPSGSRRLGPGRPPHRPTRGARPMADVVRRAPPPTLDATDPADADDQPPAPRPVCRDRPARRRPGPRDPQPALDDEPEPRPPRRGLPGGRDRPRPAGPPEAGAGPPRDRPAPGHRRGLPPVRPGPGPPAEPGRPQRRRRRPPRLLRAPGGRPGDRDPDPVRPRPAAGPARRRPVQAGPLEPDPQRPARHARRRRADPPDPPRGATAPSST